MSGAYLDAFFQLHRDLPREGPGEPADIAWVAEMTQIPVAAQMADIGCGPGADIGALLDVAPQGHVTALDKTPHFVDAARARWRDDARVTVLKADMARIHNDYDLIWSAGAVYFMGVTQALQAWRKALRPHGVIAFTEACWFTDDRSERAIKLWHDIPDMTDAAGNKARVEAAGYEVVATRKLSDAAWEAYYRPLDLRLAALRKGADANLTQVLDEAEEEAACWRAHRDEFGYLLHIVRPR